MLILENELNSYQKKEISFKKIKNFMMGERPETRILRKERLDRADRFQSRSFKRETRNQSKQESKVPSKEISIRQSRLTQQIPVSD